MIKWVNQNSAGASSKCACFHECLVNAVTHELDVCAITLGRFNFGNRRTNRHEHCCFDAEHPSGKRDTLRVITGAGRNDSALTFFFSQFSEPVVGTTNFE